MIHEAVNKIKMQARRVKLDVIWVQSKLSAYRKREPAMKNMSLQYFRLFSSLLMCGKNWSTSWRLDL